MPAHIVKSFDDELTHLHDTIARMGKLAQEQFDQAIRALVKLDAELAARTIAADAEVDALNEAVNEHVLRILALRAPMADDLRLVVTAMKVASTLERVADLASNTAKRSMVLRGQTALPAIRSVKRMAVMVRRMLSDVVSAYVARDAEKAMAVWAGDQEVDGAYSALFRELLTYMMEDPRNIAASSHLLFIAKNIERIGDHATNMGEMVHFLVTGRRIAGDRPKNDTTSWPESAPA
jgi:phosphate transport system protein